MTAATGSLRVQQAWAVLGTVLDPEVPALSISDLGLVREISESQDGLHVVLTPTYSGCPATEAITQSASEALTRAGLTPHHITLRRAPAWTSDWISGHGREQLREYGIAPPGPAAAPDVAPLRFMARPQPVPCPRCGSHHTERLAAFGATACKALHRCLACREPFEHFKPI